MAVPTTVGSLCRRLGEDLAPAPGFTTTADEITAVHISELPDPTGYLSGGELLLTTGLTLPGNKIGCERYVSRLKRAGLIALAIGLGPVYDEPPPALLAACRKLELTLLIVPAPTPFLTITKAYWQAVSRTAEQQLKDVLATQRALVEAAASTDPVASVLRTLARALDGWAATFTPDARVDQIHPLGFIDDAEQVRGELSRLTGVHSAASFSAAGSAVVVYPLAVGERIAGYLAVGTPGPLDANLRRPVLTATALLSLDAVRRKGRESAAEATQRCVGLLVDLGFTDAARRLATVTRAPVPTDLVRALAVRGRDGDEIVATVRNWCPAALAVTEGRHAVWFLLPPDHPSLEVLDAALAADATSTAAISDIVPVAHASAVRALVSASVEAMEPGTRNILIHGPYDRQLVEQFDDALDTLTGPQLDGLIGYLRHRGQWDPAARALGVHRNTLRHRIERCRERLVVDLDDPDVAAELWLFLRRRGLT